MCEYGFEGGLPRRTEGGKQGQLEPSTVLIGAFEVEVSGITDLAFAQDGVPRRTRLKPDIEDIVGEAKIGESVATAFFGPCGGFGILGGVVIGEDIGRVGFEPDIGAFLSEGTCDRSDAFGGQ